ncbi:Retrovirus-related Pol polyprotein from transposon RE1 [Vitis vinifera]|uniref:Retrovirus-related Pol polyprotein from transposon RE1 n=1 Tax=Vitis vinifera TaxID=29760 RepID=A0A438GZR1_VITVI|nr:Retrovirus-related Pol polyprotein from transposon RE1 [Vitis vinifera]
MLEVAETTTTAQSKEIVRSQQPGELQNIQAAYRLDGKNYLKWSQLVRTVLKGKGKIGHRMGTGPKLGDPHFEAWDEEDFMIMAWLWNSMTSEISNTCMFLATAKDIWDAIQQTVIKTKCLEDAVVLKDFIEQDRVYDFLVGLNPEFDQVRIYILGKQEVPCFNEVVALIRGEESRRSVMLEPQTLDGSALVAKTEDSKQGKNDLPKHLDSGATDHMTSKSQLFHTYTPSPSNKKIAVANGFLATVAGFGDIYITSTLILKNVLHEQGSGRRIGLAKERSGLYHLESSKQTSNNLSSSFLSSSNKDTIWLYHLRLGGDFNDGRWSFEPLDLPHVSTHGDKESESSPIPTGVTRNFPQVLKVYSREKAIPEQKQVQESNSDPGNEITIRSNPPLHTQLDEEIYMNIPPGFEGNTGNKSLGTNKAKVTTLFIKHSAARGVIALLVYVDDIMVTGNDEREKHEVKQRLAIGFKIKELGKLKYFLSIEVAYSAQGIFISQQKYVTDLLAEIGKIGCKPVSTLMDPNHKLGEAKEEPVVDKRMHKRLVGRLIYLAHTWPDIAYSMSVISQFMHDPREPHLQIAYRVLHYLKGNPGKGILFKKNNTLTLKVYTDANYVGSLVDQRSTTRYCTFLGGTLVIWRSKKQNVVARSSAESEFRIIAQGLCELLWLKIILDDLRIKWNGPMKLYCDNKSTINITHNPIQHDRTKHNEIDRHFIKEKLEEGVVCMSYVPSEHQLADILTKGQNSSMFHDLVFKLGMEDISQLEEC